MNAHLLATVIKSLALRYCQATIAV